jgi:hypothetical protein
MITLLSDEANLPAEEARQSKLRKSQLNAETQFD